jgi:hypothetical protein
MRNCYHIEGVTDLSVIREQSNVRLKPGNKFSPGTEESVIHLHKADAPCTGSKHEFYSAGEHDEEMQKRFWEAVHAKEGAPQ